MGRIFTTGFETELLSSNVNYGGDTEDPGVIDQMIFGGAPVIDTTNQRSGRACVATGATTDSVGQDFVGVLDRAYFFRHCVKASDATPAASPNVINIIAAGINILRVRWNAGGTLSLLDSNGTQVGSDSAAISDNTYACIQLKIIVPTAGNGTAELYLNGALVVSSAAVDVNNIAPATIRVSGTGTGTLYWDDMACNDDQGSFENTYPNKDGVVKLALPISDNAVGTGWETPQTTGADTTNLCDAVKALPPAGVTHSDADANNNKYAFNAANLGAASNLDVNCETYTTLGIDSDDIIVLAEAIVRVSCDSATGTNNMAIKLVSNPADSAALTVNAEKGVVASTEPTGWKSFRGARVYSPTVTLGTSPVVRASKTLTGSTRAHMVDLMGVIVEYIPVIAGTPVSGSDSGSGSESFSFVREAPDTGASVEQFTFLREAPDIGLGTESVGISVFFSEVGASVESTNISIVGTDLGTSFEDSAVVTGDATKSDTDTGAGTDESSFTRQVSDSGASAEVIGIGITLVQLNVSSQSALIELITRISREVVDSGTSIENASKTTPDIVSLTDTDVGTSSDSATLVTAVVNDSDAVTGSDSCILTVSYGLSDIGSSSEVSAIVITSVDYITSVENGLIVFLVSSADVGTGSENSILTVSRTDSDTGSSTESASANFSAVSVDSGPGIDEISAFVHSVVDSGSSSEVETLQTVNNKQSAESGVGTFTVALSVVAADSDVGIGIDAQLIPFILSDTGIGSENSVVSVSSVEAGTGSDNRVLIANYVQLEVGSITEFQTFTFPQFAGDSGIVNEAILLELQYLTSDAGVGIDGGFFPGNDQQWADEDVGGILELAVLNVNLLDEDFSYLGDDGYNSPRDTSYHRSRLVGAKRRSMLVGARE